MPAFRLLAQIRQHTGWHFPTAQDKEDLENWLRHHGAREAHTADALFDSACERLRSLRVEFPAEGELERVINAAYMKESYRFPTRRARVGDSRLNLGFECVGDPPVNVLEELALGLESAPGVS